MLPFDQQAVSVSVNHEIGLGAAISLFLFPLLLAVVIFQLKMVRKESSYGL